MSIQLYNQLKKKFCFIAKITNERKIQRGGGGDVPRGTELVNVRLSFLCFYRSLNFSSINIDNFVPELNIKVGV